MMHLEGDHYSGVMHPSFYAKEGERIDFYCPLCMQSLDAAMDENLVEVTMVDSSGFEQEIYFSRIAGEESAYLVSDMIHSLDH